MTAGSDAQQEREVKRVWVFRWSRRGRRLREQQALDYLHLRGYAVLDWRTNRGGNQR